MSTTTTFPARASSGPYPGRLATSLRTTGESTIAWFLTWVLRYGPSYTHPYEAKDQQSNYDIATNTLIVAGQNGASRSLIDTNFNNFAPRIGFAYDLYGDGKTALRGGYGIYYFLDRGGVGNQLSNNPDFNGTSDYSSYSGYRINLSGQAPMVANSSTNSNTTPGPYPGNDPTLATGPLPSATPTVSLDNPQNVKLLAYPCAQPHVDDPGVQHESWSRRLVRRRR